MVQAKWQNKHFELWGLECEHFNGLMVEKCLTSNFLCFSVVGMLFITQRNFNYSMFNSFSIFLSRTTI